MIISDKDFRDKVLIAMEICYDWSGPGSLAILTMRSADGTVARYCISGLRKFAIFEDFGSMYVSHCKLIYDGEGVYLSLDPFQELAPIENEDNFCFWGSYIEGQTAGANNANHGDR